VKWVRVALPKKRAALFERLLESHLTSSLFKDKGNILSPGKQNLN